MWQWLRKLLQDGDSPIWQGVRSRTRVPAEAVPGWARPSEKTLELSNESKSAFQRRLAEAAVWCSQRGVEQMWSEELRPAKTRAEDEYSWVTSEIVEEVCSRRSKLLGGKALAQVPSGRLLRYAPDENVVDGAAEAISKGFFDVCDTPAWDTWVWFTGYYLVSWIPAGLVKAAQDGIDVNPVSCIEWVPDDWLQS